MDPASETSAQTRLGVFAGAGELPLRVIENAMAQGYEVYVYALDPKTERLCETLVPKSRIRFLKRPACLDENFRMGHADGLRQAVFAGKVSKWTLVKRPVFDQRTWALWQKQRQFNDDSMMLTLIREFEDEGITVLPQTDFMQGLFAPQGMYTRRKPTPEEQQDIAFGFDLAKEMGRLDVGQTVVVVNGMVLAVEAIEGTDQAIIRTQKWARKKGGVVVKVEKPNQDTRFDVPTVGPRTLKSMKKAGLKVLAIEAGKTIVMEKDRLITLADRWDMTVVGV